MSPRDPRSESTSNPAAGTSNSNGTAPETESSDATTPAGSTGAMNDTPVGARFTITVYTGTTDTLPIRQELTWLELERRLSTFQTVEVKDGPLWSPVIIRLSGTRCNDAVEAITLLILEGDHWSAATRDRVVAKIDALGLAAIIHTTFSHGACPKGKCGPGDGHYRVVLMPVRPIRPDQYLDAWSRVQQHIFFGTADEAAKDVSRAYFLPIKQPGTTAQAWGGDGSAALDWETLPPVPIAAPPTEIPKITAPSVTSVRELWRRAAKSRIRGRTLNLLYTTGAGDYRSPSEADAAIAAALIGAGLNSNEVLTLILASPRGKAADRKGQHLLDYWRRTIANAAAWLANRKVVRA
jgi:hypothetical protein